MSRELYSTQVQYVLSSCDRSNCSHYRNQLLSSQSSSSLSSPLSLYFSPTLIIIHITSHHIRYTILLSGTMMTLLDIPSWAAALRKLVMVYQLAGGGKGLEEVSRA